MISGYLVNWKGYGGDKREPIEVSIENGLQVIKRWVEGDNVFILEGGAYSFANVESIEPITNRYGDIKKISVKEAGQHIGELIEGKRLLNK